MLGFMDYVQNAFYEASRWDRDNSYGTLNATSRNILDFSTPEGLRFHVSSLSSPNFATSYTLGSIGLVDGSLSYLYSSLSLSRLAAKSSAIDLHHLVPGYRQLQDLRQPDEPWWWEIWHQGKRIDRREALLYGRLFLPRSTLEALYLRRLSPKTQLKISCVSDSRLPNGGTILAHLQHDAAKHNTEYIYSTDSALFGVRGLYNFGPDPPSTPPLFEASRDSTISTANEAVALATVQTPSQPHGRFSAGGEIYYGLLNKSGGISTGLRFATLPSHTGFPYTMTLTLNPLMGNLSSTYSVLASPLLALSSRFDFNVYSYESELQIGTELWRQKEKGTTSREDLNWARLKLGQKILEGRSKDPENDMAGCLKARIDQRGGLGLLWEGRVKELLYSCGATIDLKGGENMMRSFGVEVQYSS
ncbi:MAG: Mitochondrial distribution and morphology protein 10 [Alectoria fallacina]|uniref:Mitochondrial distribution and morphology protein 10 n=1 Tax=Alectoria fallacina TaxID=1903189 RepID=A0A8H3G3D1_9LECA|nr:MAG: Mitochondrial distribution and morphology protein 10 [Alectoria fallacina]